MPDPFDPLGPAEQILLAGLETGDFDRIGDGAPPDAPDPARDVRAALLRFLLLRAPGAPRLHEKGLRLSGARIVGPLDLEGCRIPCDIGLSDCRFEAALVLRSAMIDTLMLDGSRLPALIADKLEARGGVYLRGAEIAGMTRLPAARLGAALVCDGARLLRPGDMALDASALDARGGAAFRGATIEGTVSLRGARLDDVLDLTGAALSNPDGDALRAEGAVIRGGVALRQAAVRGRAAFTGARVAGDVDLGGGRFENRGGAALELNRAQVEGALMLREGAAVEGLLNLNGATVDALVDAPESWPGPGDLALNRFRYRGILSAPSDAERRLDWLSRQEPARWGEDFWPQPYEQLAAVLSETGHAEEARRVLVAKERLQRRARRARARPALWRAALWLIDGSLKLTVAYGRRPLLAAGWLALFWLGGAAMFGVADRADAIRPNVAVVLRSPEWVLCDVPVTGEATMPSIGQTRPGLAAAGETQLDCWRRQPEAGSYPPFNAFILSLDAVLPALDSGQSSFWAPDVRKPAGYVARGGGYVLTVAGWALSLLAVAGFSGLVRSR